MSIYKYKPYELAQLYFEIHYTKIESPKLNNIIYK